MTNRPDNAPTVEELVEKARYVGEIWTVTPRYQEWGTLLIQLADALEESQRGYHHKDDLANSWRRKCGEARALADRWEAECNRQMDLLADEMLIADRYKAALESIAGMKVATAPTRKLDNCLRLAREALRPVDAPSMDEKLKTLDRVTGSWKDRPSEHDCWDLDDKTTCGLCEQFQTPVCEHEWTIDEDADGVCTKCGDVE